MKAFKIDIIAQKTQLGKMSTWAFDKEAIFMPLFSFEMPLFSSPYWNVNIRPESHVVPTIKIDGSVPYLSYTTKKHLRVRFFFFSNPTSHVSFPIYSQGPQASHQSLLMWPRLFQGRQCPAASGSCTYGKVPLPAWNYSSPHHRLAPPTKVFLDCVKMSLKKNYGPHFLAYFGP